MYAEAIARQVPLLAAVPNDASTRAIFPAAYVGFVAVNGVDSAQQLFIDGLGLPNNIAETSLVAPGGPFSALGAPDGTWDESNLTQGSSNATPLVAGIVALAMQKYPDATPNQILQSLVHNTGAEDHELQYDPENGYGHGVASLGHVLRVDPSGYDDENPVLDKSIGQPSAEEIAAAEERFASASPQPADPGEPAGNPDDSGDAGIGPFLVTGAIVAGVVIVGAVVLTIVLVRRSHRKDRGEQS
ncbi:MAG: hypothetical protein K0R60_1711 [Microbacterium sp.]|nr:hypothetical protein [Microbacterium sp.]